MTRPQIALLGVASSAGAHHAGQDRAPDALRAAGLVDLLRAGGLTVEDRGDVARSVFAVDHANPTRRNVAEAVRVARAVADAVARTSAQGWLPLVVGGDCTITLGVVAGMQRRDPMTGLLYFDGDADLGRPTRATSGILDGMVVAHLLGLAETELARLDRPPPMLTDDRLVLLGYNTVDAEVYDANLLRGRPRLAHFPGGELAGDPGQVAGAAVAAMSATEGSVIVHFDVDAIESGDVPLGNFPHYGEGVSLEVARVVLTRLCAIPGLAAIVLTEVNPSYEPSGVQLTRYVHAVSGAIAAGLAERDDSEPSAAQGE